MKTLLTLALLAATLLQANAATYLLLSQTNAFAAGIIARVGTNAANWTASGPTGSTLDGTATVDSLSVAAHASVGTLTNTTGQAITTAGFTMPSTGILGGTAGGAVGPVSSLSQTDTNAIGPRPVIFSWQVDASPTQAPTNDIDYHGLDLIGESLTSLDMSYASLYPLESSAKWYGPGNIKGLYGGYFQSYNGSTGLVTLATSLRLWGQNVGNGKVITWRGLNIDNFNNTGSGVISNAYGIRIAPQTAGLIKNVDLSSLGNNNEFGAANFTVSSDPGKSAVVINQAHSVGWFPLYVTSASGYGPKFATAGNGAYSLFIQKDGTGSGTGVTVQNKGTGDSIQVTNGTNMVMAVKYNGSIALGTNILSFTGSDLYWNGHLVSVAP